MKKSQMNLYNNVLNNFSLSLSLTNYMYSIFIVYIYKIIILFAVVIIWNLFFNLHNYFNDINNITIFDVHITCFVISKQVPVDNITPRQKQRCSCRLNIKNKRAFNSDDKVFKCRLLKLKNDFINYPFRRFN